MDHVYKTCDIEPTKYNMFCTFLLLIELVPKGYSFPLFSMSMGCSDCMYCIYCVDYNSMPIHHVYTSSHQCTQPALSLGL